jgi:hypothetical protein
MKKTMSMGLIAGVFTIAMVLSTTLSITNVSASKNEWGDLASDMGGKLGEHSSDPDHDGVKPEGNREGVGNLDLDGDEERDHPSETADTLREACEDAEEDDPRCP